MKRIKNIIGWFDFSKAESITQVFYRISLIIFFSTFVLVSVRMIDERSGTNPDEYKPTIPSLY